MPDRSAPIVVTPRACPFVALDGDRDRRLDAPDPLHRCYAEQIPRARSISHQAEFCLSPTFPTCPIFQDWASRAAAEPVAPRVSVGAAQETATRATAAVASDPGTTGADPRIALTAMHLVEPVVDEVIATRPVPSYRAVPPTTAVPTTTVPTPPASGRSAAAPLDDDATVASQRTESDPASSDDDVPMVRSMPVPRGPRPPAPVPEEDWMAPPPWLRQPTGPVWVAEAVPPPDALADVGTQGLRRARRDDSLPSVLAEAAIPASEALFGAHPFGEDTTGMPPGFGPSDPGASASAPVTPSGTALAGGMPDDRVVEAIGTGSASMDPGTEAELSAARYRADLVAGLEPDEETGAPKASSRQRRVPIDVQSSGSSVSQARPTARSTGSREWEGPRRFEAYAATQRRRPPTSVLVGGSAVILAVLLVGAFLLPGMLMGGAPAATGTPAPTAVTAAVVATQEPRDATPEPERTERPEKTPKPKTYKVRSGDTLIKIARRHNTSVAKIQCLNDIKNPNNVAVGRVLLIPPKGYRCSDG